MEYRNKIEDTKIWATIKDVSIIHFTAHSEYLKAYEKQTAAGVDTKTARVEGLKAMHDTEARRLEWLAKQYEAAGELKPRNSKQ